jgi:ABC-type multidrug transport system ATPase subunit/pSer/pThr/pTyr-binding forkhead associated (FHA) protein/ABC-type multidrug transport system permease subunit
MLTAMASWSLLVRSGEAVERRIILERTVILGRAVDGEGRLDGDPKISRDHARITPAGADGLTIEDLGSANGTRVNGQALGPEAARELNPGDVIEVGNTTLLVDRQAGVASPSGPAREAPPAGPAPAPQGAPRTVAQSPPTAPTPARQPLAPIEQVGSPSSIRPVSPGPAGAPSAELLWGGGRAPITPQGLTIGRDPDNDLVIDSTSASRRHARVTPAEGRYFLADLGTRNGTLLNGERLHGESRWLNSGDKIEVGREPLRFLTGEGTRIGRPEAPRQEAQTVHMEGDVLTLGRDPANDVVLDDPNVSRFHADVRRQGDRLVLRDLGSRNGTRLDHEFVSRSTSLGPGSEIGIGPFRLVFDGARFVQRDDRGALRLRAEAISTAIKGKVILNQASISIEPGEFVVIIGESGSGKTTMIRALAGVTSPSSGRVMVSGEPVLTRLTDIGYVPQDEIVHRRLTVHEGLRYAAALRLPRDSSPRDVAEAVDRVLHELSLGEHSQTLIGSLSGGQRKRAGVGTELLNRPSLLFLDEPTTGLDPGLETRLMELFRALAEEGTRAVTVVTHATKNLDLADKVCVMGQGGELCFFGRPAAAKEFFGVSTYDGIYTALEDRSPPEWRREFDQARERQAGTAEAEAETPPLEPPGSRPRPNVGRQAALLAGRYMKLVVRDRRNLALLLGQVPLIALGIALLFHSDVLRVSTGDPNNAALLIFLAVTTAIWLGSIDGSREIIKERALMERERAVGVKLSAYLASKAVVLFVLVAVQCVLLAAIIFGLRSLHQPASVYLAMLAVLVVTGFVAVGMGLLISSLVSSEDQAASFIPLVLIPQLLFAGAIVPVSEMSAPIAELSNLVFARHSFAAAGSAVNIHDLVQAIPPEYVYRYGDLPQGADTFVENFFVHGLARNLGILVAFLVAFFAATYAILAWRRPAG